MIYTEILYSNVDKNPGFKNLSCLKGTDFIKSNLKLCSEKVQSKEKLLVRRNLQENQTLKAPLSALNWLKKE